MILSCDSYKASLVKSVNIYKWIYLFSCFTFTYQLVPAVFMIVSNCISHDIIHRFIL